MNKWLGICVICVSASVFGPALNAETLYLKSGERVTGKIVAKSPESVMIVDDDGTYLSYSSDEIEKIGKLGAPEEPADKAGAAHAAAGGNKMTVKLKEGAFKISLPAYYVPVNKKDLDGSSIAVGFTKIPDPDSEEKFDESLFLGINIFPIGKEDLKKEVYATAEFQTEWLENVKRSVVKSGSQWVGEKYELFERPAIMMAHVTPKKKSVMVCFVKGSKWYKIDFVCGRGGFDKEWPSVEQSLKTMEIQEDSGVSRPSAAGEIKDAKKSSAAEMPAPKAEAKPPVPAETTYILPSKAGIIKILLPGEWKKNKSPEPSGAKADGIGTFTLGDNAKECKALLSFGGKYDQKFKKVATKESQIQFLSSFAKSLEKEKVFGGKPLPCKYEKYFGAVCLVVSYAIPDANYSKDIYFIKNGVSYKIAFTARSKETYDKEWPVIENSLKTMEIQEIARK